MASKLKTQEIILQSPNGLVEKTLTVGNDGVVTGAGKLLNVYSVNYTDAYTASVTANTWYDFPSLSITLTPTSANSRFLIISQVGRMDTDSNGFGFRILRNTIPVGVGTNGGSRPLATSFGSAINRDTNHSGDALALTYLDSPNTTDSITYKIQFNVEGTLVYLNRNVEYANSSQIYNAVTLSTLIIQEIGV